MKKLLCSLLAIGIATSCTMFAGAVDEDNTTITSPNNPASTTISEDVKPVFSTIIPKKTAAKDLKFSSTGKLAEGTILTITHKAGGSASDKVTLTGTANTDKTVEATFKNGEAAIISGLVASFTTATDLSATGSSTPMVNSISDLKLVVGDTDKLPVDTYKGTTTFHIEITDAPSP